MALIRCPECHKEISDKSEKCIHCGFPIGEELNEICLINGESFNLLEYKNIILNSNLSADDIVEIETKLFYQVQTITIFESHELLENIKNNKKIPRIFNSHHVSALLPRCPHCGSTSISTGARGVNWTLGLIGASKTVNRCANCGHTWTPRR